MSGNTFGQIFKLTTFGESHGPGLGGVVDGCPAGIAMNEEIIQKELDRRKPGQGGIAATARKEKDQIQLLSGVFEGKTTGTSIGFYVVNEDQRSRDYSKVKDIFRPGHADMSYQAKYGIRDYRGGGRSSGRETVCRVAGGAIAQELLRAAGIEVRAYTMEIGGVSCEVKDTANAVNAPYFAADPEAVPLWEERIREVKSGGDTLGGIVGVDVLGAPAGLGEPVFDKLDARLAYAMMGVGAVKGVEIGSGIQAARVLGSENNDSLLPNGFSTNHAGGILGGISSGQTIHVRAAIKPIPSIAKEQQTVDLEGHAQSLRIGGRHDICAIPRIVPVLKSMALLTIADALLLQKRQG